jgi:lipopolysaccharide/colanic/teichoic acid biosynthesis glycosyltransferase
MEGDSQQETAVAASEPSDEVVCRKAEQKGFYPLVGKRLVDIVSSSMGLLILSPLLVLVAILIKISSAGPVFFVQERVGRRGKLFRVIKFRSMRAGSDRCGPAITSFGDSRITPVGAFLRRTKIDELPQLLNVLMGDMSLVGPRPEHPDYVRDYTRVQRHLLRVRPGITDPASIAYRHEELLLGLEPDPERYYREHLLSDKLALSLEYVEHMSMTRDISILFLTAVSLFSKTPGLRTTKS